MCPHPAFSLSPHYTLQTPQRPLQALPTLTGARLFWLPRRLREGLMETERIEPDRVPQY